MRFEPLPAYALMFATMLAASARAGHLGSTARSPASIASTTVLRQEPDVTRLETAVAHYREVAGRGGWPRVPVGRTLREGDAGPEVAVLRARLAAEAGRSDATRSAVFDAGLAAEVRAFQTRYGLEVDGIVGPRTRAAMNVPAAERLAQLERNLRRHLERSLPPPPRVEVNIAAQELRYVDESGVVLEMRTVVGRPDWATPVFDAAIESITFAPYWNVPPRIATLEILPAVRRDAAYLGRNDMEVIDGAGRVVNPSSVDWASTAGSAFPYRIRQRPGPRNPLGDVKFHFPNPFAVYLHDTPNRAVFMQASRALSHGCVRLERALDLAWLLLQGKQDFESDAVRAAIAARQELSVQLDRPVPITLYYQTAWVDADGAVQFRPDIYDRDGTRTAQSQAAETDCAVPLRTQSPG